MNAVSQRSRLARAVDGLVGAFSPARGVRRELARRELKRLQSYEAGNKRRVRAGWNPGGGSADADIEPDRQTVVERFRDIIRNNGIAAGIVSSLNDNIVGTGFWPQPRPRKSVLPYTDEQLEEWVKACREVFATWAPHADIAGRKDWGQLLRQVDRSQMESGDCFPHFMWVERPRSPLAVGIELLEADMVETPTLGAT